MENPPPVGAKTRFETYEKLVESAQFKPLPAAPAGFKLREMAPAPEFLTRLAADAGRKHVYALANTGNVYSFDLGMGALVLLIKATDYLDPWR